MDDLNNKLLTVDVPLETLKKYCLWSIIKFFKDAYHTQQNSSRNDLLGGFMDRWINRIPESLIFQKLLEYEDFDVVNDDFFYIDESAKNAPDIIGLVKEKNGEKKFYPFYIFDISNWSKFDQDAPFIEMKTTRSSQKLATIAKRKNEKIDDKFFALVESNINTNYFLYLMNHDIYDNQYEFVSSTDFLRDKKSIDMPNEVITQELQKLYHDEILFEEENDIIVGNYTLCGIFKGNTISKYASEVGMDDEKKEPICPRYLKDIMELNDYANYHSSSFSYDYHVDEIRCIPILIEVPKNSYVFIENYNDKSIIIRVYGQLKIRNISYNKLRIIDDGFYKLKFDDFIYNLFKYYYLDDIIKLKEYSHNYFESKRIKLDSGLFYFYGDEFKNNKFELKPFIDAGFEIKKLSKSSVDCYCENEINYLDNTFKDYFKLKFKNNGIFDKNNSKQINECKTNDVLYRYDEENDYHLNLNIDISENSKFRFLEKYASYFKICVDGTATIYDSKNSPMVVSNNFYKITIKNGYLDSKSYDINPFKKDNELILNENNFYIPDNLKTNIKVKFDIIDDSKIFIINDNFNKKDQISYLDIIVDGKAKIDGYEIMDDYKSVYKRCWRLKFDEFVRTSKIEEYILSKSAIISSNESYEKELIRMFKEYINKLDRI